MKNYFVLILVFTLTNFFGQAPTANDLVKIHEVTTTEMNTITSPETGSFVFNTTENKMFLYDGSAWSQIKTGTTSYPGHFIISGTGSQVITGLPFEPSSVVFMAHANVESTTINADNAVGNNNNSIPNSFGSMNGYARNDSGTINQQVIYVGGNGNSINDISRYANASQCIGIRYGNQNGDNLGITSASLTAFTTNGFNIDVNSHIDNLLVMYIAYE